MKKLLAAVLAAFSFACAQAQYPMYFGKVTETGLLGNQVTFAYSQSAPVIYTVSWSNDGTAATACSYKVLGSIDGTHYFDLTGTLSCTSNGSLVLPASGSLGDMVHIANKPVMYLQVYIVSYTAGDGTTAVTFRYMRGAN